MTCCATGRLTVPASCFAVSLCLPSCLRGVPQRGAAPGHTNSMVMTAPGKGRTRRLFRSRTGAGAGVGAGVRNTFECEERALMSVRQKRDAVANEGGFRVPASSEARIPIEHGQQVQQAAMCSTTPELRLLT